MIQKLAEDLNIFPRKTYRWPTDIWKDANITNQGQANQNHCEPSPHTCQKFSQQKDYKQVLARMWRRGNPHWCSHIKWLLKIKCGYLKLELAIWSRNFTSGYTAERKQSLPGKAICTSMPTAALFTIAKIQKQPKWTLTDECTAATWFDLESIILNERSQSNMNTV